MQHGLPAALPQPPAVPSVLEPDPAAATARQADSDLANTLHLLY